MQSQLIRGLKHTRGQAILQPFNTQVDMMHSLQAAFTHETHFHPKVPCALPLFQMLEDGAQPASQSWEYNLTR